MKQSTDQAISIDDYLHLTQLLDRYEHCLVDWSLVIHDYDPEASLSVLRAANMLQRALKRLQKLEIAA